MSVFQRLFLTFFIFTTLSACTEEENKDPEAQTLKEKLTGHSWQNSSLDNMPGLMTPVWEWVFTEDGRFTQKIEDFNTGESFDLTGPSGTYTIANKIIMASGHTAFELNIYFDYTPDENTEPAPEPLSSIKLTTVYIEDDVLYFGLLKRLEDCNTEEHYYEWLPNLGIDEEDIVKNYEDSNTLEIHDGLVCHGRPIAIDFDRPHYGPVPISTQQ